MDIVLYNNTEPKETLGKTLENGVTKNILLYNMQNTLSLDITLADDTHILNYNYATIQLSTSAKVKTRYYFISNKEIVGNKIILHLHEDVLETYKNEIKNSVAHIVRSRDGNRYLNDPKAVETGKTNWIYKRVGQIATAGNYYVINKGGV